MKIAPGPPCWKIQMETSILGPENVILAYVREVGQIWKLRYSSRYGTENVISAYVCTLQIFEAPLFVQARSLRFQLIEHIR